MKKAIKEILKALPVTGPIARNILDKQWGFKTGEVQSESGTINKKEAISDFIEAAVTLAIILYGDDILKWLGG